MIIPSLTYASVPSTEPNRETHLNNDSLQAQPSSPHTRELLELEILLKRQELEIKKESLEKMRTETKELKDADRRSQDKHKLEMAQKQLQHDNDTRFSQAERLVKLIFNYNEMVTSLEKHVSDMDKLRIEVSQKAFNAQQSEYLGTASYFRRAWHAVIMSRTPNHLVAPASTEAREMIRNYLIMIGVLQERHRRLITDNDNSPLTVEEAEIVTQMENGVNFTPGNNSQTASPATS